MFGQVPTGVISGTVIDPTGAVISGAKVLVSNSETGLRRDLATGSAGVYSTSALAAGRYHIEVAAPGFKKLVQDATVLAGAVSTVDFQLQLGNASESVTVEASAAQLTYESHAVEGTITRDQIQSLPLNGRHFLQLAGLQPGVNVSPASLSVYNNQFNVSIMGGDDSQTRITVDGVNNQDQVQGGTQQNFSQEVVQEFQISTTNLDLSTGLSASGAINIVSRTGTNDFHGGGYFFYRDHNTAAYPGLQRDPLNPDPFFVRRQIGGTISGPIVKNKLFFFANAEHTNQTSVANVQPTSPDFAHFGIIYQNPYNGTQPSFRFDYQLNQSNTLFARYSHDGNKGFGPRGGGMPSNWVANKNWADQSMLGWTNTLSPNMVNDLRVAYTFWSNRNLNASSDLCPDCLGLGMAQISVDGAGFTVGNQSDSPQGQLSRHYIVTDNFSWQKGNHRLRFGGEMDHVAVDGFYAFDSPGQIKLYSPDQVRAYNAAVPASQRIPIPATFNTMADILMLPMKSFEVGVGDPSQPPPFQSQNANSSTRYHLYFQDTWKVTPRLTLNYGLGWNFESNLLNHDLNKPQYLAPVLGAGNLGASHRYYKDFSPALGFAYSPFANNNTVFRGGVGIYY
ncbi:MAG: TonB-dependent receptor, partial [Acidobacteria bacterium]|nr:TonB-dependent receptor [Acidobacteriota bacterium]